MAINTKVDFTYKQEDLDRETVHKGLVELWRTLGHEVSAVTAPLDEINTHMLIVRWDGRHVTIGAHSVRMLARAFLEIPHVLEKNCRACADHRDATRTWSMLLDDQPLDQALREAVRVAGVLSSRPMPPGSGSGGGGGGGAGSHPNGIGGSGGSPMPVLVPSTYGWKPEGDNWVPRAEHEALKTKLAASEDEARFHIKAEIASMSRATKLADEAGALRSERDDLLRENATLRRKLEAAERKGKR